MSKVKLSKEAIAKLRVVEEQIVKSPKFYDQDTFGRPTSCGTVCCIAGWLHYNEVGPTIHNAIVANGTFSFRNEGSTALGVSDWVTNNLFSGATCWPSPFAGDYYRVGTAIGRAKVAVKRIEYFIETGE